MELKYDKTIYIISGTCGVGKSSVSYKLAEKYNLSAHINADNLYNMVVGGKVAPWKDNGTYKKLLWTNINSVVENFIVNDFVTVIDYVVFPEDLYFIKKLKDKYDLNIKYIVLMADENTLRFRDDSRTVENKMGDRVVELLKEFIEKNINEKFIINTSLKNIEEIVLEIINDDRFII
jgi:2-phosphoglycerate kinase